MNEDFLHYVWKFQKFHASGLRTVEGAAVQVRKVGLHNTDAGPDFLCSEVVIGGQLWAGMVEMHLRSSHWYAHGHETDPAYDNVVLHVVWEHDMEIYRKDESCIPTLVLKDRVELQVLSNYFGLLYREKKWIHCEREIESVDDLIVQNWLDRLFLERLEQKTGQMTALLATSQNDWEAVLFVMLCKNFGLKLNGDSFQSIARSLPYAVVKKCRQRPQDMEALLLGQAGLLEIQREDLHQQQLSDRYRYLQLKYTFSNEGVQVPKFFRLRPPNFPTLRLAQFASLWCERPHLFSELITAKTRDQYFALLQVSANDYWDTHYNFGTASVRRKKKLSKPFMELLIINTVLPLKYFYGVHRAKDISEEVIQLASTIQAEENTIVNKFRKLRRFPANALTSQALLQLKKNYCDQKKCLQCYIGNALMKGRG